MRKRLVKCLFVLYLLTFLQLSVKVMAEDIKETDVTVELVSYDYLSCMEANREDSSRNVTLWMRFRIYPSIQYSQIESLRIMMVLDTEKLYLHELPLPEPDRYGFFYQTMSLKVLDENDEAIERMLRESTLECEIRLREVDGNPLKEFHCKVLVSKAYRKIFQNAGDYLINISKIICKPIEFEEYFYFAYPGIKEYISNNLNCSFYSLELLGTAKKESEYLVLGVEYVSKSKNIFLLKNTRNPGASTQVDHADMIENGTMPISIYGILCVNPGESICKEIKASSIYALYSPEYAGSLDISDAGDRMDGPKVLAKIETENTIVSLEFNQ